jgi:hypothetical protein
MDQAAFEALADEAARNLVPLIDAQNFGECGTIQVPVADTKAAKDQAFTDALIGGFARITAENCANSEGKKQAAKTAEGRSIEIVYPAGTWKAE